MKRLHASDGTPITVDDDTYEWAQHFIWCHIRLGMGYFVSNSFAARPKRVVYLHRLILDTTPDMVVHHLNGDSSDNRRCNMLNVTQADNIRCTVHPKAHTYFRNGIFRRADGTYRVYLRLGDYRWIYLATFATIWEARICRELVRDAHFLQSLP